MTKKIFRWGLRPLSIFLRDLRFAARMLAKNRGATAVAAISLAIAIGPNVVLFSIVNRLLLATPSAIAPEAGQIFNLSFRTDKPDAFGFPSYADLIDFRSQAGNVASFVGEQNTGGMLSHAGHQRLLLTETVTENYFSVLGLKAAAGRTLEESDAQFASQPPVVISESLAQREYGGAAKAVGQAMILSGKTFTIVGVMPRDFVGLEPLVPRDAWVPYDAVDPFLRQRGVPMGILVRLRAGVPPERAEAVLTTAAKRLAKEYPVTDNWTSAVLSPFGSFGGHGDVFGDIILSVAGLVVLIACANLVGILLAQGEARRHEFALRAAMGATRSRLVRQLVAESLLLSLLGGAVGLLLAYWVVPALSAVQPVPFVPLHYDFRMDGRALAYTLLLTVVAALAAGLVPAWRLSRTDLATGLKSNAPVTGRRSRFRGGLVIGQIAFSTFFLFGAGLLVRSFLASENMRPGFDPASKVLQVMIAAAPGTGKLDLGQLTEKLRAVPGVRQVSFPGPVPPFLTGSRGLDSRVAIPGVTSEPVEIASQTVGPHHFEVMGTPLLRGREFNLLDSANAAVVNETFAQRFWGSANAAMGKVLQVDGKERQIVGVVPNGMYRSLNESPMPYLFLSTTPPAKGAGGEFLIETSLAPEAVAGAIRQTIQEAARSAYISNLVTLRQLMRFALLPWLLAAGLIGGIALLGMFLAGVGLYGLVAYSVGRRTQEIGVRMALGAGRGDIVSLVLRDALSRVGIGVVIGVGGALAAARLIASALYLVSPADPVTLLAAVMIVAVVGILAAYVPARRALRVDPMTTLRSE